MRFGVVHCGVQPILDSLLDRLSVTKSRDDRDVLEDKIADEMWHLGLERYAGWTARPIMRVTVLPGREVEARAWVADVLGKPWPTKRVERELGRMVEPLFQRGEQPPLDLFDVSIEMKLCDTQIRSPRQSGV